MPPVFVQMPNVMPWVNHSPFCTSQTFIDHLVIRYELVKRIVGGDRSRLVMVPGNHDVDWNTAFQRDGACRRQGNTALAKVHLVHGTVQEPSATFRQQAVLEDYLSVSQLAKRIPYCEQTIRNLMSAGEFKEGVHYYKRRRRVMFRWSQVEEWLRERAERNEAEEPFYPVHHARTRKKS